MSAAVAKGAGGRKQRRKTVSNERNNQKKNGITRIHPDIGKASNKTRQLNPKNESKCRSNNDPLEKTRRLAPRHFHRYHHVITIPSFQAGGVRKPRTQASTSKLVHVE